MVGERLLDLRKEAGLTQDELAEILNINKHSISSYEREKSEPPDAIKIAIANYFNVSIDYLLGISTYEKPFDETKKYFKLPDGFPDEATNSLSDYAMFLTKAYKSQSF